MSSVTNRIPFDEAADLLSTARACVAFVVDGEPHVEPAVVRFEDPRFVVGLDGAGPASDIGEVTLVIDEGVLFFDLRAIYVRGAPTLLGGTDDDERSWFEVEPVRVTCWDYGRLRATDGPD